MHFFVVLRGSPALLGMPDIDNLGILTINHETIDRHLGSGNNEDNRKRNCQYKGAVQTEGGIPESCTNKRQDAERQNQCNADNTAKPSFITNPMVTGKNKNEKSFLSDSTKILSVSFQS